MIYNLILNNVNTHTHIAINSILYAYLIEIHNLCWFWKEILKKLKELMKTLYIYSIFTVDSNSIFHFKALFLAGFLTHCFNSHLFCFS
jgi:hypothetical protein